MVTIERFFQFLDYQGLKHTPIESKIGVSNGYLGKMRAKKASIGSDVVEKILSFFPNLSPEWLITGNGPMLKSGEKDQNNIIQSGKNSMNIANSGTFLNSGDIPDKLEEKKECDLCKEKDKVIKSLEKQIELLERIAKMEDKG